MSNWNKIFSSGFCRPTSTTYPIIKQCVATGGARGAEWPDRQKICQKTGKNQEKRGKIGKKRQKSGSKGKNRDGSFTLPLLTDRAG